MEHKTHNLWAKTLATFCICGLGLGCMEITNGQTGVGWAIFGLFILWGIKEW